MKFSRSALCRKCIEFTASQNPGSTPVSTPTCSTITSQRREARHVMWRWPSEWRTHWRTQPRTRSCEISDVQFQLKAPFKNWASSTKSVTWAISSLKTWSWIIWANTACLSTLIRLRRKTQHWSARPSDLVWSRSISTSRAARSTRKTRPNRKRRRSMASAEWANSLKVMLNKSIWRRIVRLSPSTSKAQVET